MTVQRLSAQSVKIQLSAEELAVFLHDAAAAPDSPQMLQLISFMLAKAELASGIPFTSLPVTVELLNGEDGSLSVYFTVQTAEEPSCKRSRTVRTAAGFSDRGTLKTCCALLRQQSDAILGSQLYQYRRQWILSLKLKREKASAVHHLLLEYGRPFRLSAMNRARLSEYGSCLLEKDAVQLI